MREMARKGLGQLRPPGAVAAALLKLERNKTLISRMLSKKTSKMANQIYKVAPRMALNPVSRGPQHCPTDRSRHLQTAQARPQPTRCPRRRV
jgi:hypothetical protein